jgi:TRAP-type C4-dicarboxylate transport system substrate-binding protein
MNRRSHALGLLATIAAAAVGTGTAAQAATGWDMYVYNPVATVSAVKGMNRIIAEIEKETNGALTIRLHLGGSLPIKTTNITQAVSQGIVQMGDDGYFLGNVPIGGVLRLPMLIRTPEEFKKAQAIMQPYIDKAFAKKGVLVLGTYVYPFQVPFSRKKLTDLDDVKGQKIRVTSPEQGAFIQKLGGAPVTLGAPEVPSALDRGVVDGVLTASSGGGNTWRDLLKYNYRIGINYFDSLIVVNKAAFDKLAPDVQAKVRKIVTDLTPSITEAMAKEEEALTKKMAAGGMVVTEEKPEDRAKAEKLIAPYWDEWAKEKGPEAIEALKKVRAALGR